jgi:polysaccharide export outer membrane protein
MVRDPYWLHAYWELAPRSVERAQSALGPHWHTTTPVLRVYHVSGDGTAIFPMIGQVHIAGKTIGETTELLRNRYMSGYLTNPQVNLTVRTYARKMFTILGQVQKPGTYPIEGSESVSLLQAIGMAGGYTRIANPNKVIVKRREGGVENVYQFNAKKMARSGADSSFSVMPGDVITVAESIF